MLFRLYLAAIILSFCFAFERESIAGSPQSETRLITFGVVPQQAPARLARLWTPLTQHLSRATGETIRFATAPDIPTFEERLFDGQYDVAYVNPLHYVLAERAAGYQAFARVADRELRGLIVVRADSPVRSLDALAGGALAFPSPNAFAASLLTRANLRKADVPFTSRFVRSHDSVYRAVASGVVVAGGGVPRTFATMPDAVRSQLRVLQETPGYSPHAFAAHPRVAPDIVRRLADALVALPRTPDGAELLDDLGMTPLTAAAAADWDDVRRIAPELEGLAE
ncbi:MAG: phosphate/phosphite/phosphonate ABC transporter substrate-binding protein [Pseudomonadota bacterium]